MGCNYIGNVSQCALDLVQLLQLGRLEKGAITNSAQYNSRNGRWFSQKATAEIDNAFPALEDGEDTGVEDVMFIKHDSLVRLNYKRGKTMSPEYYRVLGFFSKYYNKWWVTEENQFSWILGSSSNKKNMILGRLR